MKLYHNGKGEGWQIPGQQDKGATRVDVPNSPADLCAWLNARRVPAAELHVWQTGGQGTDGANLLHHVADELEPLNDAAAELLEEVRRLPRAPGFCDACGQSSAGKLKLSQGADVETVVAWMMGAQDWQLRSIAAAINELSAELENAGRVQ